MKYKPYNYQKFAARHGYDHKEAGLFLDMGLGKTVVTLTIVERLLYHDFEVSKVLVVAPKMVAENVWEAEIEKWEHTRHLRCINLTGKSVTEKIALLKQPADIYIINRDVIAWLVGHLQGCWPFDMMVVDELSSFKSTDSKRFKALRLVRPLMKRVIGLTGTPTGDCLVDLWPEMYLLDMGKRLGKTVSFYRQHYLTRKESGFGYRVVPAAEKAIHEKISDICISMKAEDYIELPERIDTEFVIKMPDQLMKKYKDFERDAVLRFLNTGVEITALSAAALMGKLLQFANGAVYDEEKKYHTVHDLKLDALSEIVEARTNQNILVFYSYRHDLIRIMDRFPFAVKLNNKTDVEKWNNKKIPLFLLHPASASHGLNLQMGGDVCVYFGLPWSLELYLQGIARLLRLGQQHPVYLYRLLCQGTVDMDVVKVLTRKKHGQDSLMDAVKAVIKRNT